MALDDAWIHFQVPAPAGGLGVPSTGLKNFAALPAVLQDAIRAGGRWVFACDPQLASGKEHVMTDQAWLVTCAACRRTAAHVVALKADPGPRAVNAGREPPVDPVKANNSPPPEVA